MKNSLQMMMVLAAFVGVFSSCVSVSTMQTARTTEKGEFGFGAGANGVAVDLGEVGDTLGVENTYAPLGEVTVRYGITEKLDVGLKLGLIGLTSLDAKYMLVGDHASDFALSTGLQVGFLRGNVDGSAFGVTDISLPVYTSYHPTDWLAVYAAPRYLLRLSNDTVETTANNFLGSSVGIRLGRRFGVIGEYSFMSNLNGGFNHIQITGGLVLGIN